MEDSILITTKKMLNVSADFTAFDMDIILYINSAFSVLQQIGVGPSEGFFIEGDSETWEDYLILDAGLNMVRTFVFLKVKMLFDPPATSFLIEAMNKQLDEYTWRISTHREWMLDPVDPMAEEVTG